MTELAPGDQPANFRLINEAIKAVLDDQIAGIERIETKGTILLGFSITAAQFLLTQHQFNHAWRSAALIAFAVAFVFGTVVVAPYRAHYPPSPVGFFQAFQTAPPVLTEKFLAGIRARDYKKNKRIARRKERFWWLMLGAIILAVGCSARALPK
jgi:hypothetical protein